MLLRNFNQDIVLGLVAGEGCFTFSRSRGRKVPAFSLSMHVRDHDLIVAVRNLLGIKNKVYKFKSYIGDGIKRGDKSLLIVREYPTLKNIIVPFFYNKLTGHKALQFDAWLESIGNDPEVPITFKKIYWLVKAGFYDEYLETGNLTKIVEID